MKLQLNLEDKDHEKTKSLLWQHRHNSAKAVQEILAMIREAALQELEKVLKEIERESAMGWRSYIGIFLRDEKFSVVPLHSKIKTLPPQNYW